jgi:hypothetical protein
MNRLLIFLSVFVFLLLSCDKDDDKIVEEDSPEERIIDRNYDFGNGSIPRNVLESYLSRAIDQGNFCQPPSGDPEFQENLRMLQNIGAKFIGRAAFVWTPDRPDDEHFEIVTEKARQAHNADPDFLLQCCIFEAVFKSDNELTNYGVDKIKIPNFVFEEFDLPIQKRNFDYEAMLYQDGLFKNHWVQGASIPDITQLETQMYFYYRAVRYINAGFEGIHFGQIELMAKNDKDFKVWKGLLDRIREYAVKNARRGSIICDAHVPSGGIVLDNDSLLLDFHSFPQRPQEICGSPYECFLRIGFIDAFYKRSKGGVTPSGWSCESLPYLVGFDNSGASNPGVCGQEPKYWPWGWDEISWFAHCDSSYRNYWLEYAWDWIEKNDPNGFLEMPGYATIAADPIPREEGGLIWTYRINKKSEACPDGFGQEETTKMIWQNN